MKKFLANITKSTPLLLILCVGLFILLPEKATASLGDIVADTLMFLPGWLSIALLQVLSLLLYLAGTILNYVMNFTVVDMADNIAKAGINDVWRTIRDVANMGFIFILLYAAIQLILGMGQNTRKLIVNVIIVALLINFSLFFTKLVIDASNVLAITFYGAMTPGSLSSEDIINVGIANSMMEPLQIQTLASEVSGFDGTKAITIGILGSIFVLIATFVFLAVSVMFIIRFVVLIFVLILSPIAFMAMILPQLQKYAGQWKDALIGQAFFAPIYFMMTWIVISVSGNLYSADGSLAGAITGSVTEDGNALSATPSATDIGLVVNFLVVIALLIASLVIAKEWSNKAGGTVSSMTKWALGAAGGATMGLAARGGRNLVGSRAADMTNNDDLRKKAAEGSIRARLQLAAANKASKSSFDLRSTPVGNTLQAGKAQKGGFIQDQKDRQKQYEQYKPTDEAKKSAEAARRAAKSELDGVSRKAYEEAQTAIPKHPGLSDAENNLEELRKEAYTPDPTVGHDPEAAAKFEEEKKAKLEVAEKKLAEEKKMHDEAVAAYVRNRTSSEQRTHEEALGVEKEMTHRMENMAVKAENGSQISGKVPYGPRFGISLPWSGISLRSKDKASSIRAASKGKSKKDKALEAYKDLMKDEEDTSEKPKEEEKKEGGEEGKEKNS